MYFIVFLDDIYIQTDMDFTFFMDLTAFKTRLQKPGVYPEFLKIAVVS